MSNIKEHKSLITKEYAKASELNDLDVPKKLKDVFLASNGFLKISEIDDKNIVVNHIHKYISYTILDKGVNVQSTEDLEYLKLSVVNDILKNFSHFTLEDIRLSFYYGVRGELGEYYGLNPITFYNWLKSYKFILLSEANKHILPILGKKIDKEKTSEPTQKEVDFKTAERLIEFYEEFKKSNEYDLIDIGNIAYNLLRRVDLIKLEDDYKKNVIDRAKVKLKQSILSEKKRNLEKGKYWIKIDEKKIFESIENNDIDYQDKIKIYCKRIALQDFFVKCKEQNMDFKSEIITKLNELHNGK